MKKSELLLNPYKEHLKKPYLHGAGILEIDGVQYSGDEYITLLEEENRNLKEEIDIATKCSSKEEDGIIRLSEENKKLKSDLSLVIKERDDNIKQNKKLSEEKGQLKSDLAFKNTMLDNVSAEYESSQDVIKKLKKRVKEHTTYSVKAEFIKKFGE